MPKLLSLFSSGVKVRVTMVNKKLAKKILNAYSDLRFPASFHGIPVFREALKKKLGITMVGLSCSPVFSESWTNFFGSVDSRRVDAGVSTDL